MFNVGISEVVNGMNCSLFCGMISSSYKIEFYFFDFVE